MIQKPTYLASENAEPFQDKSVVQAYRHRPPYPAEVFDILAGLISAEPRRVLDVGCGTGNIARNLVERVEWLDAVDVSQQMIEYGKQPPYGNHPRLRWLQGRVEDVELHPPLCAGDGGRKFALDGLEYCAAALPRGAHEKRLSCDCET
jgi:SAM-dependent methyltransferase